MNYDPEALPDGMSLHAGRFADLRFIARGTFGMTYRARDTPQGDAPVVVKEFFPRRSGERVGTRISFFKAPGPTGPLVVAEALRQVRVCHPAVARTVFTFEDNETAYIAMEWVEGKSLEDLRLELSRNQNALVKIYLTVLDAILHMRGVRSSRTATSAPATS